jgi:hypothetical protein
MTELGGGGSLLALSAGGAQSATPTEMSTAGMSLMEYILASVDPIESKINLADRGRAVNGLFRLNLGSLRVLSKDRCRALSRLYHPGDVCAAPVPANSLQPANPTRQSRRALAIMWNSSLWYFCQIPLPGFSGA